MGRSGSWFAVLLCLSCGGSPKPAPKATVDVASAPSKEAPATVTQGKRAASDELKRYWVIGVRPQSAVYADVQGLTRTDLFRLLLNGFLAQPELPILPAQRDCISDALASARELAFGLDGSEAMVLVRFEPSTMRRSPVDCLSDVLRLTPDPILSLLGVKAYEAAGGELLVIRDGMLLYGSRNSVTHSLRPDRAAMDWPSGLELSPDQYLAFTLTNPNVDGSPYTQLFDGSGGLFVAPKHFRLETRLEFFDETRAVELETELRQNLDLTLGRASTGATGLEGITLERDGRSLRIAFDFSGTASEQGAKLGAIAPVAIYTLRTYLRNAKQAEARMVIRDIAEAYAVAWSHAPVARNKRKLWSLPPVPKAIPRGTKYQTSPDEWRPWHMISYANVDPQYYQYEVVAAPDGSSAEVIARGDLDGDGTASKFSLRLERGAGEVSIAPEIAETDPSE